MIFVTGSYGAGKQEFTQNTLGFSAQEFSKNPCDNCSVFVYDPTIKYNDELFNQLKNKSVVIFPEIGCGLVPLEKERRLQLDLWGKLGCALAKESSDVYRVHCGIGEKIK